MTQPSRDAAEPVVSDPDAADTATTDTATADTGSAKAGGGPVGEVLEQVRWEAVRLLEEVPQPRALRVQAGEVRVEVEWATAGDPAQPVVPASEEPATRSAGSSESTDTAEQAAEPDGTYVSAPAVGVFYRAPEPAADPFVTEGDTVAAGQQVAIVEAMKLMIPVEADQPGRVAKVLKENGEPVEYGEPLFELEPEDAA